MQCSSHWPEAALDAHWPEIGSLPVDIRRISTGGIYDFRALAYSFIWILLIFQCNEKVRVYSVRVQKRKNEDVKCFLFPLRLKLIIRSGVFRIFYGAKFWRAPSARNLFFSHPFAPPPAPHLNPSLRLNKYNYNWVSNQRKTNKRCICTLMCSNSVKIILRQLNDN